MDVPDEITDFIAKKLTHNQKRGFAAAKSSSHEMHNDRRVIDPPKERGEEELRRAQLFLAGLALELPADQRETWLREVLEFMGLTDIRVRKSDEGQACWPYNGTPRGYAVHLNTYTRPCGACARIHQEALNAELSALGVETRGDPRWKFQLT